MFDPFPKPQFHTYPLRTQQLSKLNEQISSINTQLFQNRSQIQQLNHKFSNDQYQMAYMNRLKQKQKILNLKKEELENINKLHMYHKNIEENNKKRESKIYHEINQQYKYQIEQKKRRKSQQKLQEINKQKQMLQINNQQMYKLQKQNQLKKQLFIKQYINHNIIEDINKKNNIIQAKNSQKQLQKQRLQKLVHYKNDKAQTFDNYYKDTKQSLINKQQLYSTHIQPITSTRQNKSISLQQSNITLFLNNQNKKHSASQQLKQKNKMQMKAYLQNQVKMKQQQNILNKMNKLQQDRQRSQRLVNNVKYDNDIYNKNKNQQYLYSDQLSKQYNEQFNIQMNNKRKSLQHTYMNNNNNNNHNNNNHNNNNNNNINNNTNHLNKSNTDANLLQKQLSPHELGRQKNRVSLHNPLINPINFSIGMTNPYILKQYENRKQQYSINRSNLAQIGNNSIKRYN